MFQSFRMSMAWVHTWFGLVLGFVLMVVFFFGSLSVFDREIDRWAIPASRFEPQPMPSFDRILKPAFDRITKPDPADLEAARARVVGELPEDLPVMDVSAYTTHRDPVLTLYKSFDLPNSIDPDDHIHGHLTIDPRTGVVLDENQLKIGSEFFYPLHYGLHLYWKDLGYWIVGLAALSMLVALVSGVVIHRKIFRELFTFRPKKNVQRSVLDLHNLTGVVALPFHFMFALSGLIIFAAIYFPTERTMLRPQAEAFREAESMQTGLPLRPAGVPAPLASVDAMVAEAQRRWAGRGMAGEVGFLFINHYGDRNSTVSIYRAGTDRVPLAGEGVHFEGTTGRLLREDPPSSTVMGINDFITGLHLQHFRHWLLRALYFIGGIAGTICIATGLLFFIEKRRRQHATEGAAAFRWIDAFAVTAVTGTVIAALALMVVTRLLPDTLPARAEWQGRAFWFAWFLAMVHALWRSRRLGQARFSPAWREQAWAIAVLACCAAILNWAMTGDHLIATLMRGYWPVAGVDLVLILAACVAAASAVRLGRLSSVPAVELAVDDAASVMPRSEAANV